MTMLPPSSQEKDGRDQWGPFIVDGTAGQLFIEPAQGGGYDWGFEIRPWEDEDAPWTIALEGEIDAGATPDASSGRFGMDLAALAPFGLDFEAEGAFEMAYAMEPNGASATVWVEDIPETDLVVHGGIYFEHTIGESGLLEATTEENAAETDPAVLEELTVRAAGMAWEPVARMRTSQAAIWAKPTAQRRSAGERARRSRTTRTTSAPCLRATSKTASTPRRASRASSRRPHGSHRRRAHRPPRAALADAAGAGGRRAWVVATGKRHGAGERRGGTAPRAPNWNPAGAAAGAGAAGWHAGGVAGCDGTRGRAGAGRGEPGLAGHGRTDRSGERGGRAWGCALGRE